MPNDGLQNEYNLKDAINNKTLSQMTDTISCFVSEMLKIDANNTNLIQADKVNGTNKPDIYIESTEDDRINISIKKGSNNSVHQEKVEIFIRYCKEELDMTDDEERSLLLFLYGDTTTDGSGGIENRVGEEEARTIYRNEVQQIQNFIDRNKRNLIERFLIYGKRGRALNLKADALYHGNVQTGSWCFLDDYAIDYLIEQEPSINPGIGPLYLRSWGRNLDNNPNAEANRHSIQIMWNSCRADIEQIHESHPIPDEETQVDYVVTTERQIGDNSHGFTNQNEFIEAINGHRYRELSPLLKRIIKVLYPTIANSEIISAQKRARVSIDGIKNCAELSVNDIEKTIEVHTGSGFSGHQEPVHTFVDYCLDLGMTELQKESFLRIHYGDGTTDGSGSLENRLGSNAEVRQAYHADIEIVQPFISAHKYELLERFLIYGKNGRQLNKQVDYIYYGNTSNGVLAYMPDVIETFANYDAPQSLLNAGGALIQTYSRNSSGRASEEYRRESIQVKIDRVKHAILANRINISNTVGTAEGDWEEYDLTYKLNKNKSSRLWRPLLSSLNMDSNENLYAVKVSGFVHSHISDALVNPKADVYLVVANINNDFLLQNNYWLDEEILSDEGIIHQKVSLSGISCKRPDSRDFTYMKFTIETFTRTFNNTMLGAGICLFCKKDEDLPLNSSILQAWGISYEDFIEYFQNENPTPSTNTNFLLDKDWCKSQKAFSISTVKDIIQNTQSIQSFIFKGTEAFDEPYTANYTYINGELTNISFPDDFKITTGSGRHHGEYTIIIKP